MLPGKFFSLKLIFLFLLIITSAFLLHSCDTVTCETDNDCMEGFVCEPAQPDCTEMSCVAGCHEDGDCNPDQYCKEIQCLTCPCPGMCEDIIDECESDEDCPEALARADFLTVMNLDCRCGDVDASGGVSLEDVAALADCVGRGPGFSPECACGDLNGSQRIDLYDYGQLQALFPEGADGVPPKCP